MTRATVFVDGANFYRSLKSIDVRASRIDIGRLARKLVRGRELSEIRYYIARVDRSGGRAYAASRKLIATLESMPGVTLCLGYIQRIDETNACAEELARYLAGLPPAQIPGQVYRDLAMLAKQHRQFPIFREKGVNVALAVDMVSLAQANAFDVAYLLSGDGDFGPAVEAVRAFRKRVFVAGATIGARLQDAADVSIRLRRDWLQECEA